MPRKAVNGKPVASEGAEGPADAGPPGTAATLHVSLDDSNCTEVAAPRGSGVLLDPERFILTGIASQQASTERALDCTWH